MDLKQTLVSTPLPDESGGEPLDGESALLSAAPQLPIDASDVAGADARADDALSPAVRRLIRQYSLDATLIEGTGPSGRIRVSDVMAHLGGRTFTAQEIAAEAAERDTASGRRAARAAADDPAGSVRAAHAASPPITTLFECEMSRVLAHRKQLREQGTEVVLTSYYLVAVGEALRAVPEVASAAAPVRLGAVLCIADGSVQSSVVDAADGATLAPLHDRLLAVDKELRFSARSASPNARVVDLLVHHHGVTGSVVATPTPIGEEHVASVGIGRVRREIVLRDDDASPRVAALCYVSLSFVPERLELARANRFMAQLVRVLEHWPS